MTDEAVDAVRHPRRTHDSTVRHGPADSYQVDSIIGTGATALLWRARRATDGGLVALKTPRRPTEAGRRAIFHEARVLERVATGSDLIVPFHEIIDDGDGAALALGLAERGSLDQVLATGGALSTDQTLDLVRAMASALEWLHERGVVHADIKAANVLLPGTDGIWLGDFDAALATDHQPGPDRPLHAVGTIGYAPPEVLAGGRPTTAADIYGLAIVGLCCLYGCPPADARRRANDERGDDHRTAALLDVLRTAAASDPDERPPDGAALVALLRSCPPSRRPPDLILSGPRHRSPAPSLDGAAPPTLAGHRPDLPASSSAPPRPGADWDTDTVELGPRSVIADPPPVRRRPTRLERLALTAGVGTLAVGTALALRSVAVEHAANRCAADARPVVTGGPAPGTLLEADLDGDGCPDPISWDDAAAVVTRVDDGGHPQRLVIGEPGDQLVVGDWDCDGRATPAVYHPADGSVTRFDRWLAPGHAELRGVATERHPAHGRAGVRRPAPDEPGRQEGPRSTEPSCDAVVVTR